MAIQKEHNESNLIHGRGAQAHDEIIHDDGHEHEHGGQGHGGAHAAHGDEAHEHGHDTGHVHEDDARGNHPGEKGEGATEHHARQPHSA